jgi:orotate phosphoribosyltransferase
MLALPKPHHERSPQMTSPATSEPEARNALIALVRERSFQTGPEMKLASGRTSTIYFNMKPTMMHPEGARLIATLMLDALADAKADFIGGLEMGAVPVVTAVAAVGAMQGRPLQSFFVRKTVKEHGTQALIEGLARGESLSGRRVVIAEDVTTTGGSALKAVEAVKAAGGEVVCVTTVVDRQEGAQEAFAAAGVRFLPILTAADFTG